MNITILLGHPDTESLGAHFLDEYERGALAAGHQVRRTSIGDMTFDPVLHKGYKVIQELEPDLKKLQDDIRWCDHFVVLYPAWWSSMPAVLKGLFDRMWLPGFAFQFHKSGYWWKGLLKGKTARVFVTSDTHPLLAHFIFGDTTNEIRKGILWFSGMRPRVKKVGPLKLITPQGIEKFSQKFYAWGKRGW